MNIFTSLKQKTTQSLVSGFLILSVLAGMLSACNMNLVIPKPANEVGVELIPSQEPQASRELTLVLPTEVATGMVSADDAIQIDLNRAIYPPLSIVKENFEKGEYDSGLETIKQWVGVWKEMGVFEGIEIENNKLSPVPLDGRARVVCVDTRKKGEYSGVMFCPPLDLINGGLKIVPEKGKWDETDKPLQIIFEGTEKLVTKGSENELVYQFVEKYEDKFTRYFDSKTGQIVEGRTMVSDIEVKENEIVIEGATGVSSEFLLEGNLKINEEAGRKYYLDFLDSLAVNEQNKEYLVSFLGANPTGNKLLYYLKKHDYVLPPGLNLPYNGRLPGYTIIGKRPIEESIRLDSLKVVVFGPSQWDGDISGIREYITSSKSYDGLWVSGSLAIQYFGWAIDLKDNRLVMVAGAKNTANKKYPHQEKMTVGGYDGSFNFERDSAVASGMLIQTNRLFKVYNPKIGNTYIVVGVFSTLCGVQKTSMICNEEITQLFGQGETLFEAGK